jgi:ATP/maltotriose-dependent transcriptional regulator MalT
LHRLRGDFENAEEAYRDASRAGRRPEPGLSLLWLARGRVESAKNAVARALTESDEEPARLSALLGAYVEILLALGDVVGARSALGQFSSFAAAFDAPILHASVEMSMGSVLIAEGDAAAALPHLRSSWMTWQNLGAPYEAARVRVLIGRAFAALGDSDSAAMEFDAARFVFERLGAYHDVTGLAPDQPSNAAAVPAGGLSPRELEVLSLIAAGQTNKAIAAALVISEHTVARHVQNMLSKLGFASRASLAAYAVEQRIARPAG